MPINTHQYILHVWVIVGIGAGKPRIGHQLIQFAFDFLQLCEDSGLFLVLEGLPNEAPMFAFRSRLGFLERTAELAQLVFDRVWLPRLAESDESQYKLRVVLVTHGRLKIAQFKHP